jgi:hypothetical protein
VKDELPEEVAEFHAASPVIPMEAAAAMEADVPPAVRWEDAAEEGTGIDGAEIAPRGTLDRWFEPKVSGLKFARSNPAESNLESSEAAASRPQMSRIVIFRYAAAIGALSMCAFFIFAFHRAGAVPGARAHRSPPQINAPDSSSAPEPTSVAENPLPVPEATPEAENPDPVPEATPEAEAGPDAAVTPVPAKVAPSTTATHRMMAPERASRGAAPRVASRSGGGSRAAAFSRVPTPTSTRRMTSSPAFRGAMAGPAQSYFELANQEMHEGNYAAAQANYQRAWRIEENRAAARGRMVRARRAMQAERESLAKR